MVGRCISYWNGPFLGGHVNFQGCIYLEIVVISGGPMDPLSVALAAADGSSQSWNEVYQHPKGCRDDYMQRFNAARQIEMAAIASVKKLLQSQKHMSHHLSVSRWPWGLKRRMLERYVKHCGLDVDLCVGTLILALNQLERVTTLSSCNSVHVGAHEEEALVAFTTKSMQKLEILKKELGEHLRRKCEEMWCNHERQDKKLKSLQVILSLGAMKDFGVTKWDTKYIDCWNVEMCFSWIQLCKNESPPKN